LISFQVREVIWSDCRLTDEGKAIRRGIGVLPATFGREIGFIGSGENKRKK